MSTAQFTHNRQDVGKVLIYSQRLGQRDHHGEIGLVSSTSRTINALQDALNNLDTDVRPLLLAASHPGTRTEPHILGHRSKPVPG